VRTRAEDPYTLVPSITRIIRQTSADQPIERAATLEDIRAEVLTPDRLNALVFGGFALVALTIAIVGVAGVLAFSVNARMREFGIRLAIGSAPRHLLARVLGEGAVIAGAGLIAGVLVGLALTPFASGLFVVRMPGVLPIAGAATLLMIAAILASLLPAARACLTGASIRVGSRAASSGRRTDAPRHLLLPRVHHRAHCPSSPSALDKRSRRAPAPLPSSRSTTAIVIGRLAFPSTSAAPVCSHCIGNTFRSSEPGPETGGLLVVEAFHTDAAREFKIGGSLCGPGQLPHMFQASAPFTTKNPSHYPTSARRACESCAFMHSDFKGAHY
jgi:hypothetical protein